MANIFGIRREDKNPWERRVPLIPSHIRELVKVHGLKFYIQPSEIRVFADDDFRLEGGKIQESLAPCSVILAVKEIPLDFLEPGKAYFLFSHTIKGQRHNMPMLRRMAGLGCTLVDYERIVDDRGRRMVFFGRQAGGAGMIDTLWALSIRLLAEGVPNPFSCLRQTYMYQSLVEAKEDMAEIGFQIRRHGLPAQLVPFACGFMGYGHVSQGAQEIFDLLPVEDIEPEEFAGFFRKKNFSPYRVYKTVFREEHLVRSREAGKAFNLEEYYRHPENYEPVFEPYLPYLTVLINGIYWSPKYPRFVTKKSIQKLFSGTKVPRLRIIGDISCDIGGAVECTLRATDPKDPVFVYDPENDAAIFGFEGRGPFIMAVDNLPAEIPLESSVFFSQALKPFMPAVGMADFSGPFEQCELPPPVKRAVILYRGEFTPAYEYMQEFLAGP
jgi:alanine dehydrogenase